MNFGPTDWLRPNSIGPLVWPNLWLRLSAQPEIRNPARLDKRTLTPHFSSHSTQIGSLSLSLATSSLWSSRAARLLSRFCRHRLSSLPALLSLSPITRPFTFLRWQPQIGNPNFDLGKTPVDFRRSRPPAFSSFFLWILFFILFIYSELEKKSPIPNIGSRFCRACGCRERAPPWCNSGSPTLPLSLKGSTLRLKTLSFKLRGHLSPYNRALSPSFYFSFLFWLFNVWFYLFTSASNSHSLISQVLARWWRRCCSRCSLRLPAAPPASFNRYGIFIVEVTTSTEVSVSNLSR